MNINELRVLMFHLVGMPNATVAPGSLPVAGAWSECSLVTLAPPTSLQDNDTIFCLPRMDINELQVLMFTPVGMPNWVKQRRVFADCPALNRERYRAAEIAEQYFIGQAEEAEFRGDLEAQAEARLFAAQMEQAKIWAHGCFKGQMVGASPLPETDTAAGSGTQAKEK